MNIPIEVIAIGAPIVVGAVFIVFLTLIKYWRLWRYKPENDKGKKAEEGRKGFIGNPELTTASLLERRSVLSTPTPQRVSEDKSSVRKSRVRKFRRRRRKS